MVKNLNKTIKLFSLFIVFIVFGFVAHAQSDCQSIQCDCENIPDSDKDPGLIALCKYYEKELRKRCENGEKGLKCKENAKGPKAWTEAKVLKNNKDKNDPFAHVDISGITNVRTVKYCEQLIAYLRQKGYLFANVRVPANLYNKGYFKEAWAYDVNDMIYVVVINSKEKKSGYSYKLSVQYSNYGEYQFYVYCGVKRSDWKKFSAPCNDCDYDKRYTEFIRKYECDCL